MAVKCILDAAVKGIFDIVECIFDAVKCIVDAVNKFVYFSYFTV